MNLINIIDAKKDFGIKPIFENLNINIDDRERLGIIGPNGSGKSTILKVIAGKEPILSGRRIVSSHIKIRLVSQDTIIKKGISIIEHVLTGCGEKRELLLTFTTLSEKLSQDPGNPKILHELSRIQERMDHEKVWNLEQECKEVLESLGINRINRKLEELSGGFQKRVDLASALVAKPDVLLLDEPTNHLDANAVEWLENWLKRYRGALIMVTHDRYVLNQVTNKIIELSNGKAKNYLGNYNKYLAEKAIESESIDLKKKKSLSNLKKELAWLKKGAKARSTKQKARVDRIKKMKENFIIKNNNKLEINYKDRRMGKLVLEADSLLITNTGKKDGEVLINDFSYSLNKEERLGIIGSNGTGKSTILDIFAGKKKPLEGTLNKGETIHIGYLDQNTFELKEEHCQNKRVIDFVKEKSSIVSTNNGILTAAKLLEKFLFTPSQQFSPIKKLSGGEKRRLAICIILIESPNVLLLDEPTNDLDLETLRILEDFLEIFKGSIVIVSHDRYFLDRTIDHLLYFDENEVKLFEGNYTQFIDKQRSITYSRKNNNSTKLVNNHNNKKRAQKKQLHKKGLSFKEKTELNGITINLQELEKKKESIEKDISTWSGDLSQLSNDLACTIEELATLEERWLELSEIDASN